MKKVFAISFLSLMAVTGGARAEVQQYNLNLATAEYVEDLTYKLEDKIYNKVDKGYVAESGDTVANASKDAYIPTIARMENAIADAVDDVDTSGLVEKAQGAENKNAIMITNAAGNVIPAPVGDCANTTNKCALVTGVDANGNLALQWEVIARNVPQPTAEE